MADEIIKLNNVHKDYFMGDSIIRALAFSFLIGTISGVFPAMQASKLKPVDALRYE